MKNLILKLVILISAISSTDLTAQQTPIVYDVILCLDDRLTVDNQINRDKEIVKIIFSDFKKLVRHQRFYINSADAFRVLIAPQRGTNNEVYGMSQMLSIDLSTVALPYKRRMMDQFEEELEANIDHLFEIAYRGQDKSQYNGVNLWRYFSGDYKAEIRAGSQQKIFVLTDGYIDFEKGELPLKVGSKENHTGFIKELINDPDWFAKYDERDLGLIPCRIDLTNADVTILEINPKSGGYFEGEILNQIWEEWFTKMGAKNVKAIQRTSSIPNILSMVN